ncbi:hypothetical protein NX059_011067 [Plenodomus lindquistii]|nr:hypothetical protein NX059_011067 [Plenodomus lindquistii]
MERGIIPGNPTFLRPNPKIDFAANKVKASRTALPWPTAGYAVRRASINSFGYGGSNAHAVIDQPSAEAHGHYTSSFGQHDDFDEEPQRLHTLVVSANDAPTLKANISALCNHVVKPEVAIKLPDLAYTLSQRRSQLWHRAFVTTDSLDDLDEADFAVAKRSTQAPKVAFVFTGQGAQWPQMGKELLALFPTQTLPVLEELDAVLQSQPDPPQWSLLAELSEPRSPEHLRQPEFSQPLVTALQLCLVAVLASWGIAPSAVVGHSSGEIAAAYAAGLLDRASAIKAAFYRGRAAVNCKAQGLTQDHVGMLAVGLGADAVAPFLDQFASAGDAWIACYNSPSSVTVSGNKTTLEALATVIKAAGHFARLLQVDLAYHSPLMAAIGDEYERLLDADAGFTSRGPGAAGESQVRMFSSVTSAGLTSRADAQYWKNNMVSAVRFSGALEALVAAEAPAVLIELGPSGALAGPISQLLQAQPAVSGNVRYVAAWARGSSAPKSLMDVAGRLFLAGAPVDLTVANAYADSNVRTIVDLPNYCWNHAARYWHENAASADWRTKRFITHDLLGSKIPGTSWKAPTWRKKLRLADVPWLRDHRMGPDVLIPGTAFAAMALEAMFQKHCATHPDETADITSPNQLAYRFRDIKFDRAVVLDDSRPTDVVVTLASVPGNVSWHEFRVRTTTPSHDVVYEHCSGLVRVHEELGDDYALHGEQLAPLRHPQSPAPWYKLQTSIGTHFGPSFQKIKQWESLSGQHHCRALLSLEPPASKWNPQTYYPIHPAVLDACLQTSTPAILAGERSTLKDVMILSRIQDMVINKVPDSLHDGLSLAEAKWTGRGRKEKSQSWATNVDIHDSTTGALFLRVRGLEHVRLDVEEKPDPHTFLAVQWKPDISLMSQDQLLYSLAAPDQTTQLDAVLDLIAHKTPRLSVLEIHLDGREDNGALWLNPGNPESQSARSAAQHYDFASPNAQALVAVEAAHASPNAAFHLLATDQPSLGLPDDQMYDLVIARATSKTATVDSLVVKVKQFVRRSGCMLVVFDQESHHNDATAVSKWPAQVDEEFADSSSSSGGSPGSESPSLASTPIIVGAGSDSISTGYTSAVTSSPRKTLETAGHGIEGLEEDVKVLSLPGLLSADNRDQRANLYYSSTHVSQPPCGLRRLVVFRFDNVAPPLGPTLRAALTASGWSVDFASASDSSGHNTGLIKDASVVLVVDELVKPVLTTITSAKWDALKQLLLGSSKPVLWVTKGAQTTRVSEPDNALVQGLFRVIRREDPASRLVTLDVQSPASPAAHWAIQQVLCQLAEHLDSDDTLTETEYAERDGILLVPRVIPDKRLNDFRVAERGTGTSTGHELVPKDLHANPAQVRLQADKIGTLQSLQWCETAIGEVPIEPGKVEIEVMAVGVNFKDVATTMGIVPENEHMIGCECAGHISRVGAGVTGFKIGDRVVAQTNGTYVNRLQCVADRVHRIPSTLSFQDAATIPLVYLTAIYALFHLGKLSEGQTVLIHSAAGGVGIAAIQLAQYVKADIFVTVSSEEKRKYLADTFGIPSNRMFSSRNTRFAEQIRRETGGRGIDVILNSLIGELLDESWRLTADGGVMVEIGKRDIVDRNTLSMEPFDRNCSFRAVDLSYTREISDQLIGKLMSEVFALVEAGHIGPIHPVTVYGFDEVIPALMYIRSGQHIGKIVITNRDSSDVQVPTKPALSKFELRPDVAYLIVGGLKGLCGSLAIHMARHGARHILVMSRSGLQDAASASAVDNCASYGCRVTDVKGDVGDKDFVHRVFHQNGRIAGVIQGAMVLRDRPFEMMTYNDYHTAIHAKVVGTWNLHNAAQQEQKQPLDFFTMLSSISGVVGNKGQANYAAGNAFLDTFSYFRQSQGLRANTIDLGLIEDVGYVAEVGGAALEARFDRREWTPIDEGVLRNILGYSIMQQEDPRHPISTASAAQLVTGISYPLPADTSDLVNERRFGYLFGAHNAENLDMQTQGDGTDQAIRAFHLMHTAGTDDASLVRAAVELLQKQVAKLLRLESDLEPGKPLMAYGLDSLSAVELRGWVRQKMSAELSTLDITNASSLVGLCEKLVSKLPKTEKVKDGEALVG